MKILFIGKPGSGKGTQGNMLAEVFGISHISAGDTVRDIIAQPTHPLKESILHHFSQPDGWHPLPDEIATQVVQSKLVEDMPDVSLDGFPRNVHQLTLLPIDFGLVFWLDISDDTARERVLSRRRTDDALKKVNRRLEVEQGRLPQLVEHYREQGNLVRIDGEQSVASIHQKILNECKKKNS